VSLLCFVVISPPPLLPTLFPYTTLFRSTAIRHGLEAAPPSQEPSEPQLAPDQEALAALCGVLIRHLARSEGIAPAVLRLDAAVRSEEHTSELQSRSDLVCRLLLEKKNSN